MRELLSLETVFHKQNARTDSKTNLPKGILMHGLPGTGKTFLARAFANETTLPVYRFNISDYVYEEEDGFLSDLKDVFNTASASAPAVIFIDEFDSFLEVSPYDEGNSRTVNFLLNHMDGFERHDDIIIMAATNKFEYIPKPILRSGRFDLKLEFQLPSKSDRIEAIKMNLEDKALDEKLMIERVADMFSGMTIADINSIINSIRINKVMEGSNEPVSEKDVADAFEKHFLGVSKDTAGYSKDYLEKIAVHEVGHTLIKYFLGESDQIIRMSLVNTAKADGYMASLRSDDALHSESELENMLAVTLGGYVAEKEFLGETSAGCKQDIEEATTIAEKMVKGFGMGSAPLRNYEPPMGFGVQLYSNALNRKVERSVNQLIRQAVKKNRKILKKHKSIVYVLSKKLAEEKYLSKDTLIHLIAGN